MLREMPPVPLPAPEEPAPPEDDIMAARWEVEAGTEGAGGVVTVVVGILDGHTLVFVVYPLVN